MAHTLEIAGTRLCCAAPYFSGFESSLLSTNGDVASATCKNAVRSCCMSALLKAAEGGEGSSFCQNAELQKLRFDCALLHQTSHTFPEDPLLFG